MGALAVVALGKVTVRTEQLEAIFWKSVTFEPFVEVAAFITSANASTVLGSVIENVIDVQEFRLGFSTALTDTAVFSEDLFAEKLGGFPLLLRVLCGATGAHCSVIGSQWLNAHRTHSLGSALLPPLLSGLSTG